MAILDHDFGADALDRFGGRLYQATLHKRTPGTYNINDPAAGTNASETPYTCDAMAFGYKQRYVDGERIRKGDYRVVILRTSLAVIPEPGDRIEVPPPGGAAAIIGDILVIEVITEAQITVQVRGAPE